MARSVAYYRTPSGKIKKKELNARRCAGPDPEPPPAEAPAPAFAAEIVEHVRLVTCRIEEREVSRAQCLAMLVRVVRQHRLARGWSRREALLRRLVAAPP